MKTYISSTSILILVIGVVLLHASDITHTITHQGVLNTNDGSPVDDGMYSFTVNIYDSESSSDAVWTETQTVSVINGIYNLLLGIIEPIELVFDTHYWIGISINGGEELNPRIPLSSVPYAFHALSVPDGSITSVKLAVESVTQEKIHPDVSLPIRGEAGGDLTGIYPDPSISEAAVTTDKIADEAVTVGKIVNGAITSEKLANNAVTTAKIVNHSVTQEKLHADISLPISGNAGGDLTGTYPAPDIAEGAVTTGKIADGAVTSEKLQFPINHIMSLESESSSIISAANFGEGYAIQGIAHSNNGGVGVRGLSGASSGENYGVYGVSLSNGGRGVYGGAHITIGESYGVQGVSRSMSGRGVFGLANASTGTTYGIYGQANSSGGIGVFGEAPLIAVAGTATQSGSGITIGVQGASFSTNGGAGIWGVATSSSGIVYGVHGRSHSSAGRGVYGLSTATAGGAAIGVQGETSSTGGRGVYGVATATSGTAIGVYGVSSSPDGWAGWFQGRLRVTGTITKGGGSFEIDHPLNPEAMILRHSFVESPDMMNIYNGNVVTSGAGEAIVQLPDYFEALNRDFRYQLTVIGEFAQVIIAEEIVNNRFVIRSDKPNVKVSWQVTGIRKDRWAEENRIVVEEYKSPVLQGYYLHPVAFGLPDTRSVEWSGDPEGMKQLYDMSNNIEYGQRIIDLQYSIERD